MCVRPCESDLALGSTSSTVMHEILVGLLCVSTHPGITSVHHKRCTQTCTASLELVKQTQIRFDLSRLSMTSPVALAEGACIPLTETPQDLVDHNP